MEPTAMTAGAIATLLLTQAVEKTGEKFGDKLHEQSDKLLHLLEDRFPTTATEIELTKQEPLSGAQAALIAQQVEDAAKADPEVAQSVQAIANAVQSQPNRMEKFTHLAQEIRMEVQGQIVTHPNLNL